METYLRLLYTYGKIYKILRKVNFVSARCDRESSLQDGAAFKENAQSLPGGCVGAYLTGIFLIHGGYNEEISRPKFFTEQ